MCAKFRNICLAVFALRYMLGICIKEGEKKNGRVRGDIVFEVLALSVILALVRPEFLNF